MKDLELNLQPESLKLARLSYIVITLLTYDYFGLMSSINLDSYKLFVCLVLLRLMLLLHFVVVNLLLVNFARLIIYVCLLKTLSISKDNR